MMTAIRPPMLRQLLNTVAQRARASGVFGEVTATDARLACATKNSAAPAEFRVDIQEGSLWVSLVTADRWLSQSIEADLVHTGDKIEDLVEEELAEITGKGAWTRGRVTYQHYRSEDKLFTFRSPTGVAESEFASEPAARDVGSLLLAYEAAFRDLGDMDADEDDE